jgi:hypothetical protein
LALTAALFHQPFRWSTASGCFASNVLFVAVAYDRLDGLGVQRSAATVAA